ncbi:transpeptidase family protein [Candidatus Binatia bacterium]|nr:transpeptidase family protein [Candidatus Binatia bacterium]
MTHGLRLRIASVAGIFFVLFAVVLGRVFMLSMFEGESLRDRAHRQHRQRVSAPADRGPIVDRHGLVLAVTSESADVYVRPRQLAADAALVGTLARTLDLPAADVARKLHAPSPFVWLRRDATLDQATAVEALGVRGVGSEPSRRRTYPRGPLAAQVVGFAGRGSKGLEGVELLYDQVLRGPLDAVVARRDGGGRLMLVDPAAPQPSRGGARVELTIDASLQQVAETELEAAVKARRAAAGVAVVMDPATGEILALASMPRFDPNHLTQGSADRWRNRVTADAFEPGSTFKGVLAAAALEAGVVKPTERVFCENGSYAVGNRVVHDHDPYGWLTFSDVIKYSSNIGSARIGERLGADRFEAALRAFGFGRQTGVDLPGEVTGIVRPRDKWGRINLVTMSFGQGIAVTPIQLLRAYAAIANGGKLMRPYVVRRVVGADGSVLLENAPEIVGRPISPRTAAAVTDMLRGVVDAGTGTQAKVEGIPVAGKTGTAQKVDTETGRYHPRARMSSFVGFLPADNPRFAILVVIDSPQTAVYGGVVAAPVFRGIGEYAVDRLGLRMVTAPETVPAAGPRPTEEAGTQLVSWDPGAESRGMPSFLGLSMRDALVRAARAGWAVEVSGSGYVVAQDPPAGASAGPGKRLHLQFGTDAG